MSELHLDLSKAVFVDTDDLSKVDLAAGGSPHRLSSGNTISVENVDGKSAPIVRDAGGKELKSYNVTSFDVAGGRYCWICFQPTNGPYQCFRVPCGTISVEPM
ncbi:MAG: hypothetical protein PGN12_06135 [Sphingomonas phyllosphaerae]